jgi:peptidoglycan/LPS O-acetylase OafA/YrhL
VNIAAAFVAAFISFKLVETPCIRFGHRFVAAQQARSTTKQLVAA